MTIEQISHEMPVRRPVSVIVIGLLFIAAGGVGFIYHLTEVRSSSGWSGELFWVLMIRALAAIGGVFLLYGRNWARWVVVIWLAYHVVLSAFHPLNELVAHALLLVIISFFLFRRGVSAWLRQVKDSVHTDVQTGI